MLIKIFIHCQPGNDLAHRVSVHLPVLQHLSSLSKQYHCLTGLITACKCFNLVWLQIFILKYYIQGNIWPHFIFAPSPHCQWANLRLYLSINTSMFGWIQDGAKPFASDYKDKNDSLYSYKNSFKMVKFNVWALSDLQVKLSTMQLNNDLWLISEYWDVMLDLLIPTQCHCTSKLICKIRVDDQ